MHRDARLPDTTPEPNDDSLPGRHLLLAAALLVLMILLAYRPSLNAEFVHLDDFQYVIDNELVRQPSLAGVYRVFAEVSHPSTVDGFYQPLTMVSLMLDACLSGASIQAVNPYVFHLTNVLLHAATTVLIFLWIRTFFGGLYLPILVSLLFALHPAQVESVAWISQRKTVLATFLAVAAIIAYGESARFRSRSWLAVSVMLYFLATLAKPTTVLLPLILPLLDAWPLGRRPLASLGEKWPFALIMVPMAVVAWSSQAAAGAGLAVPNLSTPGAIGRWMGLLSYNVVLYVGNLLWPMHLSPYRALPDDLSFSNPTIVFSILGAVAILVVWIASWRFSTPFFTGLTAFGLMLAPALGVLRFTGSCVADRFLYSPLFFLLLPLAHLLARADDRFKRSNSLLHVFLALFLVPLSIVTYAQQSVWHDSKSLWTHVALADPKQPNAHLNLARIALDEEAFAAALDHAKKALELDPENAAHMHILGRAYVRLGLPGKAVPMIEKALAKNLGPNQPSGLVALGEARLCIGDETGAHSAVRSAIELGYTAERAYTELGDAVRLYAAKYDLAEKYYRKAVEAAPHEVVYRWKWAAALEYLGRYDEALRQCKEALRLSSQYGLAVSDSLQKAVDRLRQRAARSATRPDDK